MATAKGPRTVTMNGNHNNRRAIRSSRRRGFTLVELMITVAIVGVLAALAIVGYNRYVRSAASGEAKAMLQNIRGAQDVYKAETLSYLNVSGDFGAGTSYYPRVLGDLDDRKFSWPTVGALVDPAWQQLNVRASSPVRFSYAVRAGQPGTINENSPPDAPAWPYGGGVNSVDPWFIAVAAGDYDDDGVYSILYTSSLQTEVSVENELE